MVFFNYSKCLSPYTPINLNYFFQQSKIGYKIIPVSDISAPISSKIVFFIICSTFIIAPYLWIPSSLIDSAAICLPADSCAVFSAHLPLSASLMSILLCCLILPLLQLLIIFPDQFLRFVIYLVKD